MGHTDLTVSLRFLKDSNDNNRVFIKSKRFKVIVMYHQNNYRCIVDFTDK